MKHPFFHLLLSPVLCALPLMILLPGCGGGGGSSSQPSPIGTPTATATPRTTATPTATPIPASSGIGSATFNVTYTIAGFTNYMRPDYSGSGIVSQTLNRNQISFNFGTDNKFTLTLTDSNSIQGGETFNAGQVIPLASALLSQKIVNPTGPAQVFREWISVEGKVSVQSFSGNVMTLRLNNLTFTPITNAGGAPILNGTIRIILPST